MRLAPLAIAKKTPSWLQVKIVIDSDFLIKGVLVKIASVLHKNKQHIFNLKLITALRTAAVL